MKEAPASLSGYFCFAQMLKMVQMLFLGEFYL